MRAWKENQGVSVGDKSLKAKSFRIRALGVRILLCDKLGVVHRSAILALRKWRKDDQEFKTIVSCIMSLRPAWATQDTILN